MTAIEWRAADRWGRVQYTPYADGRMCDTERPHWDAELQRWYVFTGKGRTPYTADLATAQAWAEWLIRWRAGEVTLPEPWRELLQPADDDSDEWPVWADGHRYSANARELVWPKEMK